MCFVISTVAFADLSPAFDIIENGNAKRNTPPFGNKDPEAAEMSLETLKNVAVFKSFLAADPEGDELEFEIVKYPSHGSVEIVSDGQFVYRPLSNYKGGDTFSYRAVDVYGNSSEAKTVEIKVIKPMSDIYFDDMQNHWAHNSAITMATTGLMAGEEVDGKLMFNPEADMKRGDFLALSLIMAGHEKNIPFASKTVFADDSVIPQNIKSYVRYAYDKGIISGYDNPDGSVNFEADCSITRAEAAVIVGRILELEENESFVPSYKDAASIPVWASSAVGALSEIGILSGDAKGEFYADKTLSRAEGAEMICNIANYVDGVREEKKEKNLFNLFGLLG